MVDDPPRHIDDNGRVAARWDFADGLVELDQVRASNRRQMEAAAPMDLACESPLHRFCRRRSIPMKTHAASVSNVHPNNGAAEQFRQHAGKKPSSCLE